MTAVLNPHGRALIHDLTTGETLVVDVPTALENVLRAPEQYAHGEAGADFEPVKVKAASARKIETVIPLGIEGALPLPTGEVGLAVGLGQDQPVAIVVGDDPAAADFNGADPAKFDHDGNGAPGGSLPALKPLGARRVAAAKAKK
jgi:hypothetical protein